MNTQLTSDQIETKYVETGEQTIVSDIGDTSIVNTDTTSVLEVKAIFIKYNKNL